MRHRRIIPLQPLEARATKGRGTTWEIAHRFESLDKEPFDDGWGAPEQQVDQQSVPRATEVIEERAKTILAANDSPDIAFDLSINPYRGCEHGCIYCFARRRTAISTSRPVSTSRRASSPRSTPPSGCEKR